MKEQLGSISAKLDKVLRFLEPVVVELPKEEAPKSKKSTKKKSDKEEAPKKAKKTTKSKKKSEE